MAQQGAILISHHPLQGIELKGATDDVIVPVKRASGSRPMRRRKAARPVLLLLSLALVGVLYAAITPAAQSAAEGASNEQLVATGKQLFAGVLRQLPRLERGGFRPEIIFVLKFAILNFSFFK